MEVFATNATGKDIQVTVGTTSVTLTPNQKRSVDVYLASQHTSFTRSNVGEYACLYDGQNTQMPAWELPFHVQTA